MTFPILVLHNVFSSKTCLDFMKIARGMGYKTVIITNAQGSGAQKGIPSAQKYALQNKMNFMALNDISDVKELFDYDFLFFVAPPPYGNKNLDMEFVDSLNNKRWIAVFGGNDPGLTRKDLEKGDETVQVPAGDIGSTGTITLALALLTGKFVFKKEVK